MAVLPLESGIGVLAVLSAILGLLHLGGVGSDALSKELPHWLFDVELVAYGIGGIALVLGIGSGRRDGIALGLMLVILDLVLNAAALVAVAGFTGPVLTAVAADTILSASLYVRLRSIGKGNVIVAASALKEEDPK